MDHTHPAAPLGLAAVGTAFIAPGPVTYLVGVALMALAHYLAVRSRKRD